MSSSRLIIKNTVKKRRERARPPLKSIPNFPSQRNPNSRSFPSHAQADRRLSLLHEWRPIGSLRAQTRRYQSPTRPPHTTGGRRGRKDEGKREGGRLRMEMIEREECSFFRSFFYQSFSFVLFFFSLLSGC